MNIVNKKDGDSDVVHFIVRVLKDGGTLAYPTDTVYGLGCDATNKRAVKKIHLLKGTSNDKQLLVLLPSLAMAKKYVVLSKKSLKLARENWPGPLTLILTTTSYAKKIFRTDTLAVRVSSNAIAQAIVKSLGVPLISTSANLMGKAPAMSGQEVMDIFSTTDMKPDIILDAGRLKKSKGSTIINCTNQDELLLVRQGDVKVKIK